MIELELTHAVILYSVVLGILFLGIWTFALVSTTRTYHVLEKQSLWRCVFCGYTYLDEGATTLSECPQCGSINSASDKHARFVRTRQRPAKPEEPAHETARRNPSRRKRPHQRRRGPRKR